MAATRKQIFPARLLDHIQAEAGIWLEGMPSAAFGKDRKLLDTALYPSRLSIVASAVAADKLANHYIPFNSSSIEFFVRSRAGSPMPADIAAHRGIVKISYSAHSGR